MPHSRCQPAGKAAVDAGFDHVLATRLRRYAACREALESIDDHTRWTELPSHRCRAAETTLADGARAVVVESDARIRRDTARTAELAARAEADLFALENRVRAGRLADPAKIRSPLQASILTATHTPTHTWDKARIH